jgi:hypothetical protein
MSERFTMNGYELELTCGACPEQYDVFKDGQQVAYLRLRHGYFYAAMPDAGGQIVYETDKPNGDGVFEVGERDAFLTEALSAISFQSEIVGRS